MPLISPAVSDPAADPAADLVAAGWTVDIAESAGQVTVTLSQTVTAPDMAQALADARQIARL